ncbi:MAG TPA: hypothetical protein V6D25_29275 [Leptolyngbyaceae cyanobacterium]
MIQTKSSLKNFKYSSYWTDLPEENIRNYRLVADVTEDINIPWCEKTINISKYILGVLIRRDNPGWYIPGIKEILTEASIEEYEE